MKRAITMIVVTLVWTACSVAGPAGPAVFDAGQNFSLRVGESARSREGGLQVGFEGVSADSRCPKGVQCVWAGDAIVRVWLQQGAGPRQLRTLHTAAGASQATSALDHELRLVRLDPTPVAGKALAPDGYVATLVLNRGASGAPER